MEEILPAHPVLAQAVRLGRRLTETEEVRRFREAERQIQGSGRVQGLIEEIKRKQKELVHAKHYQKTNYIRRLEEELDRLQRELEDLPIVREYQQSQVEMNDLLQMIQRVVVDTVSRKIDVEKGGNFVGGCGAGGPCRCRS